MDAYLSKANNAVPIVVIDYGNRNHILGGYSSSSMVTKHQQERQMQEPTRVSSDCTVVEETSNLESAILGRRVESFDALRAVFEALFYENFGWIKPEEEEEEEKNKKNVFIVEPILASRRERERVCQMLFEEFRVSGYAAENAAVCALAGVGRLNGISVDVGAETVDCATVSDGKIVESTCRRIEGGGERCCEKALSGTTVREGKEIYAEMEKWERMIVNRHLARVRWNADDDGKNGGGEGMESYQLPDGNKISVETKDAFALGDALYCCSSNTDDDANSKIVEAIQSAVENSFRHAQAGHFFSHGKENAFECVVAHGTESSVKGLRERLGEDIRTKIAPESAKVNVVASAPDYLHEKSMEHLSWTGGAVLGKVTWNLNQQISKSAYEEWGPNVANRSRNSF